VGRRDAFDAQGWGGDHSINSPLSTDLSRPGLRAAHEVSKVAHYCLSSNALTQPSGFNEWPDRLMYAADSHRVMRALPPQEILDLLFRRLSLPVGIRHILCARRRLQPGGLVLAEGSSLKLRFGRFDGALATLSVFSGRGLQGLEERMAISSIAPWQRPGAVGSLDSQTMGGDRQHRVRTFIMSK
jgi:hypothetical protein